MQTVLAPSLSCLPEASRNSLRWYFDKLLTRSSYACDFTGRHTIVNLNCVAMSIYGSYGSHQFPT